MLATLIGSHLTREPIASPVLTKRWKWELMLATNSGSLCPEATNFGSQNLGYQIWLCTRLVKVQEGLCVNRWSKLWCYWAFAVPCFFGLMRNQNGSHGREVFKSGIKRHLINIKGHEEQNSGRDWTKIKFTPQWLDHLVMHAKEMLQFGCDWNRSFLNDVLVGWDCNGDTGSSALHP